ncbi:non-canonical purine NTP pyrophosphatase [bacterium]|nr:non-canonical purine NTP pyrophosphatase [bacterium]
MNKKITFVTGNKGKLAEVQAFLGCVYGKHFDLPEIQEVNSKKIIQEKLRVACSHFDGPVMVDDTALYIECFSKKDGTDGLPGPFIKWFLQTMGNDGLAKMALKLGKTAARASTIIGYADGCDNVSFFEGTLNGTIVAPQGTSNFGWDHIFIPEGYNKTFAAMSVEEKNQISPRSLAIKKLKIFLQR